MKTKRNLIQICLLFATLLQAATSRAQTPSSGCYSVPSGIVAWWPGENNAVDVIGGNIGTLVDGGYAPGVVGTAFTFDGTNSYVEIPDTPALNPTNITVEAWVKFNSLDSATLNTEIPGFSNAGWQYIVFKQNTRTAGFEGYLLCKLRTSNGDTLNFVVTSAQGTQVVAAATNIVAINMWYHLAGTYDGTNVCLYVNGQLAARQAAGFPLDYGPEPVFFGTSGEPYWDGKLNGLLDEVSIYNRALSATEINSIYLAGVEGKCPRSPVQIILPQPGGNFTIGIPTISYQSYTVLKSTNLASTNWSFYTNLIGNGSTWTISVPTFNLPQQYFKVSEP